LGVTGVSVWKLIAREFDKKRKSRAKKVVEILNSKESVTVEAKIAENMAKEFAKKMSEKWKWSTICGEVKDVVQYLDGDLEVAINDHRVRVSVPDSVRTILTGVRKYDGIYAVYGVRGGEKSFEVFLPLSLDDMILVIPDEVKRIGAMFKVADMIETYAYRSQNDELLKMAERIREHARWELNMETEFVRTGTLTPSTTDAYLMGVMDHLIEMTPPDDKDAKEIIEFIRRILKTESIPDVTIEAVREEYRKMSTSGGG